MKSIRLLLATLGCCAALAALPASQGPIGNAMASEEAEAPAGVAYFARGSDEITDAAAKVLDEVAAKYRAQGADLQVMIAGHADRDDNAEFDEYMPEYLVGLAQRRAANVRSYLSEHGVRDGVMTTETFGDSRPAGEHAAAPLNRRVEVRFTEGSGW